MGRRPLPLDGDEILRRMDAGESAHDLAAEFGCSYVTIYAHRNKAVANQLPPLEDRAAWRKDAAGLVSKWLADAEAQPHLWIAKDKVALMERFSKFLGLDHADLQADRKLALEERQAAMVAEVLKVFLGKLNLTAHQQTVVSTELPAALRTLTTYDNVG